MIVIKNLHIITKKTKRSPDEEVGIWIELSEDFEKLTDHSVPIDYEVYKSFDSDISRDLYAWLMYRNNGIREGETITIPRKHLVAQFYPVDDEEIEDKKLLKPRSNKAYITKEWQHFEMIKSCLEDPKIRDTFNFQLGKDYITIGRSNPVIKETNRKETVLTSGI